MLRTCSWKQLFAAGSVMEGKQKTNEKIIVQNAYTSAIEWSTVAMDGRDCDVDAIRFARPFLLHGRERG